MKNTQEESEAVDKGVQDGIATMDARWWRREARRLLVGKKGMTSAEKLARMKKASEALTMAIAIAEKEK